MNSKKCTCSFCGQTEDDVTPTRPLIASGTRPVSLTLSTEFGNSSSVSVHVESYICADCVDTCNEILAEKARASAFFVARKGGGRKFVPILRNKKRAK